MPSSFHVWWAVAFVALLVLAASIGRTTGKGYLAILVDTRDRYSLTHFQIVLWTIVILSSVLGVLISQGFESNTVKLSPELLGLMGISAGSAVLATGVKASKDAPGSTAKIAFGQAVPRNPTALGNLAEDATVGKPPRFAQIWLQEEGPLADLVVDITKFQNFIFTLVVLGFYVTVGWKSGGLPEIPPDIVWLIGISHAGYVGGKIPNK